MTSSIVTTTSSTTSGSSSTSSTTSTTSGADTSSSTLSTDTITGVTYSVVTSPTSCFALPTPTSLLSKIPYADDAGTGLDGPIDFYFNPDNSPAGVLGASVNGSYYAYDISDPSQLVIILPEGELAVITTQGVTIYAADCSSELSVEIDNFIDQIELASTNSTDVSKRHRSRRSSHRMVRRTETNFAADIALFDICGNPDTSSPVVSVGQSPCALNAANGGDYLFTCQYPGANSDEAACEATVSKDIGYITGGPLGTLTNLEGAATVLAIIFRRQALAVIAAIFDAPAVAAGVGALALAQIILNTVGADNIASTICGIMHKDEAFVISVDSGVEIDNIATITAAPISTLSATITVSANTDASSTCSTSATSSPTGSCEGGATCGGYVGCGDNPGLDIGECFCGTDADGNGSCSISVECDAATACSTNADCGGGSCIIDNCCGFPVCQSICGNAPALTKKNSRGYANGTMFSHGIWINGSFMPNVG
ncbi:uncharacterized protein A1O5_02346 [Cladophialophora psammophila CBS 110553]|uniref:Uncharacterized protein n=1 Tax=Cladophialophora psammophila CBS 110553 TaxID=1182543 RepID=W9X0P9_9EURO|nr:uncharacterized protein A1O5_02346 [Cladophialophora psammophila CBS 110553]EXJ74052.1 hypothetical protein A1O5_02346 [Cladophialophora psammophila CBS 110553]